MLCPRRRHRHRAAAMPDGKAALNRPGCRSAIRYPKLANVSCMTELAGIEGSVVSSAIEASCRSESRFGSLLSSAEGRLRILDGEFQIDVRSGIHWRRPTSRLTHSGRAIGHPASQWRPAPPLNAELSDLLRSPKSPRSLADSPGGQRWVRGFLEVTRVHIADTIRGRQPGD